MKSNISASSHLDYIKKRNLNSILNLIHLRGNISRAQVATEIGLSKTAVSSLVDELLGKGIVKETGIGNSAAQGGRRSILLNFNADYRYCLGINVTCKSTSILISNLDGEIRHYDNYPSAMKVERLLEFIYTSIEKHAIDVKKIAGMGIVVPGITNVETGTVIESPSMEWADRKLAACISEFYTFPVFVLNDVDCLTLGENWIGSAADLKNVFFVGINDGLGSAMIINGSLYSGSSGQAGEVGYTILDTASNDYKRNCLGQFGWLEQTVSGWALQKTGLTIKALFDGYLKNDPEATPVVDTFIHNLSIMISNTVALLNPDCVVIGGSVSEYMGDIIPIIRSNVNKFVPISTEIRMAKLGEKAHHLGAVAYILKNIDITD